MLTLAATSNFITWFSAKSTDLIFYKRKQLTLQKFFLVLKTTR